jgi:hypothetical protein
MVCKARKKIMKVTTVSNHAMTINSIVAHVVDFVFAEKLFFRREYDKENLLGVIYTCTVYITC